jgi:sugar phosphate isomerase/epimerase
MYISVCSGIVTHAGYATLGEGLKDLGLQAVELRYDRDRTVASLDKPEPSPLDSPDALKRYEEQLANHGVRPSALLLGTDFNQADVDGEVAWVVSAVRAAEALGLKAIRVDSAMTGQRELPLDERVDLYAKGIRRVLQETDGSPVALGVENHGFQGNDPNWLEMLFAKVGNARFGMTIDTGNFYWAGHPLDRVYEIMEHLAPRCKHTHCKNIKYPVELRNQQRELGWKYGEYVAPLYEGDIDHHRVARILKNGGYDGDLCIEDESLGHYQGAERQAVLRGDVEHFREVLKGLQ